MKLSKTLIEELQKEGFTAYYYKDTARRLYLKIPQRQYIHIATSASLSKIREVCKTLNITCRIHTKINKMTLELIADNKYIISPFIKTSIKNNYAVRKYSQNRIDMMKSQGYTINSIMYDPVSEKYEFSPETKEDLDSKLIKTVGDTHKKITENRMFLFEAGLLLAELGGSWKVEYNTFDAISQRSLEIAIVSAEALRESFNTLIKYTDKPSIAFRFFKNTGMLTELLPEILRGVGLQQSNKSNNLDLFNHIMYALDSVGRDKPNFEVLRWTCIFHDTAKPYTKSYDKKGNVHFYGHDKIGAIFATRWMEKYKFDKHLIGEVSLLCRHHLFDASLKLDGAAISRLIKRVGKEHIFDLLNLREADRYGTGRPNISMRKVDILRQKIKMLLK